MKMCCMCEKELPEERIDNLGRLMQICYIDPSTKEVLCEACNKINDSIYRSKGKNKIGRLIIR